MTSETLGKATGKITENGKIKDLCLERETAF